MAGVKPDWWIRKMAVEAGMIEPFSERVAGPETIVFGLQPCGYDARLDPTLLVFDWSRAQGGTLDPLRVDPNFLFEMSAFPYYEIPPRGFVQGLTVEYFRIPRNCSARGIGKTIYSSIGINLNISGINPGWEGRLRVHISNPSPVPIRIYGGQGMVYLEFQELDGECEVTYDQLAGTRFQKQTDLFRP